MPKVVRCSRCGRPMRSMTGWNVETRAGVPVVAICPDCQTPEENAEAEINEATLIYRRDDKGRVIGSPDVGTLTLPGAAPGSCVGCGRQTDTGLGTEGEAEWHIALALNLGVTRSEAETALRDVTGAEPGEVIDGRYPVAWRVCRDCIRKFTDRIEPVLLVDGAALPVIGQP